jgi:sulfur relay (sulfurtransferase) DsrC/TusE family protein
VAEYVDADNASFQKELEEWDEEVTAKVHKVDDVATASSNVVNVSSTRHLPEEEMVEFVKCK